MFQTIEKLLKAKKKICLIGCGVQYFEKVLRKRPLFCKGGGEHSEPEGLNSKKEIPPLSPLTEGGLSQPEWQIQQELQTREKILSNENISYLSRNDLAFANVESLTKRSQNFDDFCRYDAPRLLTNYENRYEYLKIAE